MCEVSERYEFRDSGIGGLKNLGITDKNGVPDSHLLLIIHTRFEIICYSEEKCFS